jgi:hypothetical protein
MWASWNMKQVSVLGEFMDACTVPHFDSWELNYCFNKLSNNAGADYMMYQLINPQKSEIRGNSLPVKTKSSSGGEWKGVINGKGEYINTITLAMQPSGSGYWGYEMVDYRMGITFSCGRGSGVGCKDYWTEYCAKFCSVGNPLVKGGLVPAVPIFCETGKNCEPGSNSPEDWIVLRLEESGAPKPGPGPSANCPKPNKSPGNVCTPTGRWCHTCDVSEATITNDGNLCKLTATCKGANTAPSSVSFNPSSLYNIENKNGFLSL